MELADGKPRHVYLCDEAHSTLLDTVRLIGNDAFYQSLTEKDFVNLVGMFVAWIEIPSGQAGSLVSSKDQGVSTFDTFVIVSPTVYAHMLFVNDTVVVQRTQDPESYYHTLVKLVKNNWLVSRLDRRILVLDNSYDPHLERLVNLSSQFCLPDPYNLAGHVQEKLPESPCYYGSFKLCGTGLLNR